MPESSDDAAVFYDDLAREYDATFGDWPALVRRGEILDLLIREALGDGPKRILDCSCGIGTQAIGFALHGHEVHGTDFSPSSLERAAREAERFGVAPSLGLADFRELDTHVEGAFDVVLSASNAIPHLLTDGDLARTTRAIRSRLGPSGLAVISIRDYDAVLDARPDGTVPCLFLGPNGKRAVVQVWEWGNERVYKLHLFILRERERGRWTQSHHEGVYRALKREELGAVLAEAGFSSIRWRFPEDTGFHQPVVLARLS